MGLFDFLKKKKTPENNQKSSSVYREKTKRVASHVETASEEKRYISAEIIDLLSDKTSVDNQKDQNIAPSVPEREKKYYQPDDYYTMTVHESTSFEHRVVTFEERKRTCIPSERGLYVAEILLLFYCSKGKYPHPKDGYPGFWWFKYGIRDVGKELKSLEDRGFIEFGTAADAAASLKVAELKELLSAEGLPKTGKKAELVKRVAENISEEKILAAGVEPKYRLTELGEEELKENAYVPYMHNNRNTTIEGNEGAFSEFNVWSINRLLGTGDKSDWRTVVDEQERKTIEESERRYVNTLEEIKKVDPEGYNEIKAQDDQLAQVQQAARMYEKNKDLDSYIAFWEEIWKEGGPKFEGRMWMFKLPDLYIKAKRYKDALALVEKIKETRGEYYQSKADYYIEKIEGLIEEMY
jgi:hypothetical protein